MKSQKGFKKKEAFEKLFSIGQAHLLDFFETLNEIQKNNLLLEISDLDVELFKRQKEALAYSQKRDCVYTPFNESFPAGSHENWEYGKDLVAHGKTALVVLAGGQGSRLRFEGPKGCFPISLIKKKSLFELIAEKVKYASKQVGRGLEVAWMCSPLNIAETKRFFEKHAFFGLKEEECLFFTQKLWPILDEKGDLFLEEKDRIGKGPNGNGGVFRCLKEAKILENWEEKGIEHVQIIPVDNPLATPFDYELFGFQNKMGCEVAMHASLRKSAEEKVGILVNLEGKTAVLEYSELDPKKEERALANLGIYSFSLPFIKELSSKKLALHRAKKAVRQLGPKGEVIFPKEPNGWKFEEFIFDSFTHSKNIKVLLSSREDVFAPLKNLEGEDSIDSVQSELLARDRKVFERVTKVSPHPDVRFELSQEFYYPTRPFLEKWKGKALGDQTYVD